MKNFKLNIKNGDIKIDMEKNIIEIKNGDVEILLNHSMQIRTTKPTKSGKNVQYTQKSLFDDIEHIPGELNCDYENSHDKRKRVITGQYVGKKYNLIKDTVILKEFDTFLNTHFNTKTFDFKIRIRRPYGEINKDGKQDYSDQLVGVMGVELYDKNNQFRVTLIESYNDSIGLKVVKAPVDKIKQLGTIDNIEKFGPYPTLTFRRTTKGKGPEKTKTRIQNFLESLLKGYVPTGKVLYYRHNNKSNFNARFIEFKDNTNTFYYMPIHGYGYKSWLMSSISLPPVITSPTYRTTKKVKSPLVEKEQELSKE